MAYRFILEVPDALVEDANVVISSVGDAQAHFVRDSHGLGFETPYKDFSIAAHSLRIIDAIYAWYADMGAGAPGSRLNLRVVLLRGERLSVHDVSRAQMIAAIRRDQPWVARTIPKIGEHETRTTGGTEVIESSVVVGSAAETGVMVSTAARPAVDALAVPVTILAADDEMARQGITVGGIHQVLVQAYDLSKPEHLYGELFGLELIGRGNRTTTGGWEFLPPVYDQEPDAQWGTTPEFAFLQNGPLSVAVERVGRGLPMDIYRELLKPVQIAVDMESLHYIRAMVLMRSYNVIDDSQSDAFVFRDPFAYTWAVTGHEEGR